MSAINPFAAPDELEVVRRFINTLDIESGIDGFATLDGTRVWLESWGLAEPGDPTSERDRTDIVALREALREAAEANHGSTRVSDEAAHVLTDAARYAEIRFGPTGPAFQATGTGVDHALGTLASLVIKAHADGTWARLKVCGNDACRWAFYDHARNRTSRWCSMSTCGNRMKARAYRARLTPAR
ncbi:MAG: CGNR zinc finger domain-containing protein [Actinomycetota bacterium]